MPTNLEKIKALQAKLKAVQAKKQTEKLSERSMIEIVSKLSNLKLVDLIMSTDGKEYITPVHLQKQIIESLNLFGNGRLAISELSEHVKVEFSTVERFVNEIIEVNRMMSQNKRKISYFLINNQLISSTYFSNILAEIFEMVEFQGRLPFSNIALHYDLPLDILSNQLLPLIEKDARNFTIQNEPETVIYAEKYQKLAKAKITGCLNAVAFPVSVVEILKICDLDKNFDVTGIIHEYLASSDAGEIQGKGANAIYIPKKYTQSQKDWISKTFKSNLSIDYNSLAQIGIPANKQKSMAKECLQNQNENSNLIFTDNGIIHKDLFADLEAQLFETEKVLALENIMPEFIEADEYQEILKNMIDLENFLLIQNFIFKKTYLENFCFEAFQHVILSSAEMEAEKRYKSGQNVSNDSSKAEEKPTKNTKKTKGKGGKKGKSRKQDDFSDDENDNDFRNSGHSSNNFLPNNSELVSILKNNEKIADDFAVFERDYYVDPDAIFELIISHLKPKITNKYEELSNNLLLQMAEKKNALVKNFSNDLQERIHQNLVLSRLAYSGVRLIHKNGSDFKNLAENCESFLNQKLLQEIYDDILILVSGIGPNDLAFEVGMTLSVKDRKMLVNGLPNSLREVVSDPMFKIFSGISEAKTQESKKSNTGGSDKDKKGKKNKKSTKKIDQNEDLENDIPDQILTFDDHLENLLNLVNDPILCLNRIKIDKKQDQNFINNFFMSQTENQEIIKNLAYHDRLTFLTIRAFYVITNKNFILLSGKNVPNLISFLSTYAIEDSQFDELLDLLISGKDSIMEKLRDGSINQTDENLEANLQKLVEVIKNQKPVEAKNEISPRKTHKMKTRGDRKKFIEEMEQVTFSSTKDSQENEEMEDEDIVVVDKPKARRRNRRAD